MAKAYIDPFSEGIALVFRSSGDILRSGQYPKGFVQFELQQIGVRGGGGGRREGETRHTRCPGTQFLCSRMPAGNGRDVPSPGHLGIRTECKYCWYRNFHERDLSTTALYATERWSD